jgi:hypothetical protein
VEIQWERQRFGRFRGLVDGLVVAQVAFVSDRRSVGPRWIVYLKGCSRALDGRYATEFDAIRAAEAALVHRTAMDRAANELDRLDDSLALVDRDERVGLDEFAIALRDQLDASKPSSSTGRPTCDGPRRRERIGGIASVAAG